MKTCAFTNGKICGLLTAILLGASGCSTPLYEAGRASSQEDAASVHIAVLSASRWDDAKDDIQPKFDLSAQDALNTVVPTTFALEERFMNAFGAKLKVAAPGTTFSSTDVASTARFAGATNLSSMLMSAAGTNAPVTNITQSTTSGSGQNSSAGETSSSTFASGNASNIAFASSPEGSRTATSMTAPGSVFAGGVKVDPMLRYWAAAALYQEVKLINRYVTDGAIADEYVPYVIRLQVSVMPRKRDLPYDAYSLISFFAGKFDPKAGPITVQSQKDSKAPDQNATNSVKVLPLLVTDDLEAALHSRSVDEVRQLALALSAVIQGAGIGLDLQKVDESLRSVLGNDFNSIFNVGRVSDNTIQCRFGAMNQAKARYAMIPQTHNVSLVILVPKALTTPQEPAIRDVRLVGKTQLRHALTGEPLRGSTEQEYLERAREVLRKHSLCALATNDHVVFDVLHQVAANNFSAFTNALGGGRKYYEAIWVDLCELRNSSFLSSAEFQIPTAKLPRLGPLALSVNQTAYLLDDGKAGAISLQWFENLNAVKLGAWLEIQPQGKSQSRLPAQTIDVTAGGRFVKFTFPSPADYGLTNQDGTVSPKLHFFSLDEEKQTRLTDVFDCVYRFQKEPPKTDQKPTFSMTVRASVINAVDAAKAPNGIEGSVDVIFSDKAAGAKLVLDVDKADVVSITPKELVRPEGKQWLVATNGTVTVNLKNLNPDEPVALTGRDSESKTPSVTKTVRVVRAPPGK